MTYKINKGVGRSFEFKGLRTTYVFLSLGGIIVSIFLYFILGLLFPIEITISLVVLSALISVGGAYYLNSHFGENGLTHAHAQRKCVQRIQNNTRVKNMIIV